MLFSMLFMYVCDMGGGMVATAGVCKSGQLLELVLSFLLVGPWNWSQVTRIVWEVPLATEQSCQP